jgi:hypothetical protein
VCPSRGQTVPTTVSRARGLADEVRHIRPGDFFVLRNAVHGTASAEGGPIAWLAIIALKFDLAKDVVWEKGAEPPRFEMV